MKQFFKAAAATAMMVMAGQACAVDWVTTVHVTAVETTGIPNFLSFWVDGPAGTCADGQGLGPQLSWQPRGSSTTETQINIQAAFATLLTARASGRPIKIFGRNSDCQVEFMYLN